MRLINIYLLEQETKKIEAMQYASLHRPDLGLSSAPALIGTPAWWQATQNGALLRKTVCGTISRVYWGSMGDWPMFEIIAEDGVKSEWTREGDISRYVEGIWVNICMVFHPRKIPNQFGLGDVSKIVLSVEIEESERRSDPRAPGPGGIGLKR